jgi:protein O-GlcNAc transferase
MTTMVPQAVLAAASPAQVTSRSAGKSGTALAETEANRAFAAVTAALERFSTEGSDKALIAVRDACHAASEFVAKSSRRNTQRSVARAAARLAGEVIASGAFDHPVDPDESARILAQATSGWPGLVAAMLTTAAWHWPDAPLLADVPDWLWGEYAGWLFAEPAGFDTTSEAEAYVGHLQRHLEELHRWTERNPGAAAVQAAGGAFRRVSTGAALQCARGSVRRVAELRGRIFTRLEPTTRESYKPAPATRAGRRLRVGFVNAHFGPGRDTCTMLPAFAQLDPRNFVRILFSLREADSPAAQYCRQCSEEFRVLSDEIQGQLTALRGAECDIVVFGGDVGRPLDPITRLALHRVAPLQVVRDRAGFTTGLPEIDLYACGDLPGTAEAAGEFTERLGLLRGSPHSFAAIAEIGGAQVCLNREALALPEGRTLFATVAPTIIDPVTLEAWGGILGRVPDARLAVVVAAGVTDLSTEVGRFSTGPGRKLEALGIASERVVVIPVPDGELAQIRALLGLADLYLDPLSGAASPWVAEALAMGVPVVAAEEKDRPLRNGNAHQLGRMGLSELVASNAESYGRLAVQLATDAGARAALVARVKETVAKRAEFFDMLAASDAFGTLLETAFDELTALGPRVFRTERIPLRCFGVENVEEIVAAGVAAWGRGDYEAAAAEASTALRSEPAHAGARTLRGRLLLASGEVPRAVTYLLEAVGYGGSDADRWTTLAEALRCNGQMPEAVQALETALRLDSTRVESWLLLFDLAEGAGDVESAREALQMLQKLAPDDPRVLAMS